MLFWKQNELQMVKFLLKDTKLQIKMSGIEPTTLNTNIGSPQGDGLSGVLFNIYLENSLRKLREELDKISPELPTVMNYQNPPNELQYADANLQIYNMLLQYANFAL